MSPAIYIIGLLVVMVAAGAAAAGLLGYTGNAGAPPDGNGPPQAPPPDNPPPEPPPAEPVPGPAPEPPEPVVSITVMPHIGETLAGQTVGIAWDVESPQGEPIQTAVYYGYQPRAGDFGIGTSPQESGYPLSVTGRLRSGSQIPATFIAGITPDMEGVLYFRVYAYAQGSNYWTQESGIVVSPRPAEAQEFSIEADDSGFYMDGQEIGTLRVKEAGKVKITFSVRASNVYYGGLDFRGCGVTTPRTPPGQSVSIELEPQDCTITSYWPSSGVVKERLDIVVLA